MFDQHNYSRLDKVGGKTNVENASGVSASEIIDLTKSETASSSSSETTEKAGDPATDVMEGDKKESKSVHKHTPSSSAPDGNVATSDKKSTKGGLAKETKNAEKTPSRDVSSDRRRDKGRNSPRRRSKDRSSPSHRSSKYNSPHHRKDRSEDTHRRSRGRDERSRKDSRRHHSPDRRRSRDSSRHRDTRDKSSRKRRRTRSRSLDRERTGRSESKSSKQQRTSEKEKNQQNGKDLQSDSCMVTVDINSQQDGVHKKEEQTNTALNDPSENIVIEIVSADEDEERSEDMGHKLQEPVKIQIIEIESDSDILSVKSSDSVKQKSADSKKSGKVVNKSLLEKPVEKHEVETSVLDSSESYAKTENTLCTERYTERKVTVEKQNMNQNLSVSESSESDKGRSKLSEASERLFRAMSPVVVVEILPDSSIGRESSQGRKGVKKAGKDETDKVCVRNTDVTKLDAGKILSESKAEEEQSMENERDEAEETNSLGSVDMDSFILAELGEDFVTVDDLDENEGMVEHNETITESSSHEGNRSASIELNRETQHKMENVMDSAQFETNKTERGTEGNDKIFIPATTKVDTVHESEQIKSTELTDEDSESVIDKSSGMKNNISEENTEACISREDEVITSKSEGKLRTSEPKHTHTACVEDSKQILGITSEIAKDSQQNPTIPDVASEKLAKAETKITDYIGSDFVVTDELTEEKQDLSAEEEGDSQHIASQEYIDVSGSDLSKTTSFSDTNLDESILNIYDSALSCESKSPGSEKEEFAKNQEKAGNDTLGDLDDHELVDDKPDVIDKNTSFKQVAGEKTSDEVKAESTIFVNMNEKCDLNITDTEGQSNEERHLSSADSEESFSMQDFITLDEQEGDKEVVADKVIERQVAVGKASGPAEPQQSEENKPGQHSEEDFTGKGTKTQLIVDTSTAIDVAQTKEAESSAISKDKLEGTAKQKGDMFKEMTDKDALLVTVDTVGESDEEAEDDLAEMFLGDDFVTVDDADVENTEENTVSQTEEKVAHSSESRHKKVLESRSDRRSSSRHRGSTRNRSDQKVCV